MNDCLARRFDPTLGRVHTGVLADEGGKWAVDLGTTRLAVVNIEEDRHARSPLPSIRAVADRTLITASPLPVTVTLLIATRLADYEQSLRCLSHIITFLGSHPIFHASESPRLPADLSPLALELMSLDFDRLAHVWTMLGAKHLPSVLYRMRLLSLRETEETVGGPPIQVVETTIHATRRGGA